MSMPAEADVREVLEKHGPQTTRELVERFYEPDKDDRTGLSRRIDTHCTRMMRKRLVGKAPEATGRGSLWFVPTAVARPDEPGAGVREDASCAQPQCRLQRRALEELVMGTTHYKLTGEVAKMNEAERNARVVLDGGDPFDH